MTPTKTMLITKASFKSVLVRVPQLLRTKQIRAHESEVVSVWAQKWREGGKKTNLGCCSFASIFVNLRNMDVGWEPFVPFSSIEPKRLRAPT